MVPRFKRVHVDGLERQEVVSVHCLCLPVAACTTNGLGHGCLVGLLSIGKIGRDEDDVVGVGEVTGTN